MKQLLRLVNEDIFIMNENEVRNTCKNTVGIHYAFDNYRHDIQHVLELRDAVLKDYPDISEKDMDVWEITKNQSIRHAAFTTLYIQIPIEDYLEFRKNGKIHIR